MTKQDIIKDIKWRIKDLRDTYEFWMKQCDEELDSANYNAFIALVRMDTLERLYETIKEDLQ